MKKLIALLLAIAFLSTAYAQESATAVQGVKEAKEQVADDRDKYAASVKEAYDLYEKEEWKASAMKFKEGFDAIGGKAYTNDRYNAACSYSLAENSERSFYHLFRLANDSKYSNLAHISADTDLDFLHDDAKWNELIAIVKMNKYEEEKDLDKPLVAQLEKIHIEDQKYRKEIGAIKDEFGWESDEMKAHWEIINEKDSINLIAVEEILETRGWLGKEVVGRQGNSTLFLVIQHSDIETQLKYLPVMKEAAKNGKASPSSLALLEDRVALGQGERQIYGSQIHTDQETREMYVAPLVDPENVDKRRAEVGLGPIADYVGHWDLTWDVKKHVERTAKIEAGEKE